MFIEIVRWLIFVNMIACIVDAFYRLATEKDIRRSWKMEVATDILLFIVYLILFMGLTLGW